MPSTIKHVVQHGDDGADAVERPGSACCGRPRRCRAGCRSRPARRRGSRGSGSRCRRRRRRSRSAARVKSPIDGAQVVFDRGLLGGALLAAPCMRMMATLSVSHRRWRVCTTASVVAVVVRARRGLLRCRPLRSNWSSQSVPPVKSMPRLQAEEDQRDEPGNDRDQGDQVPECCGRLARWSMPDGPRLARRER